MDDKKPSWRDLKRKLKERSEKDGPFQDGDYEEEEELEDYEPTGD